MERRVRVANTPKWDSKYAPIVFQLALLGATSVEVAAAFDITTGTLIYWKKHHTEFNEAWKKGKIEADAKVAESFYKNCIDRWEEEEEAKVVKGVLERIKVKRFIRGDKWAQSRWLSLRRRGDWTESQKYEITNNSTNINIALKEYSFDELKMLESIGYKQLPEHDGNA